MHLTEEFFKICNMLIW